MLYKQVELEFGNVGFLWTEENRRTRRKPRSKDENQQLTQPTCDTGTGSRTRATLVGGERSHHCAIPAPTGLTLCSYFANALGFDTLLIQLNDTWSFSWLFAIFLCGIEETGNLYFFPKSTFIKLSNDTYEFFPEDTREGPE